MTMQCQQYHIIIKLLYSLPVRIVFVATSRISTEFRRTGLHSDFIGLLDPPTMTISFLSFNKEQEWKKRQEIMSGPCVQVLFERSRNQVSQNSFLPAMHEVFQFCSV